MGRVFNRELVTVIATVSMAIMAMSVLQPVLPLYLSSIGISPSIIGLMFSLGMMGMVFGESAGGWLADKVGIRIPLGIGTILCIPLLIFFVFARNVPLIFTLFLAWGIVRAGVFGPGRGYIGKTVPLTQKGTYLAIYAASMTVSRSIGSFIGGLIGEHLGYDWNFYFAAGIVFLGGMLVIFGLRKITTVNPGLPSQTAQNINRPAIKAPYRSRIFIAQCVIGALAWAGIGLFTFVPLLVVEKTNVAETQVGLLFTIGALVSATLMIPLGRLSDRRNKKTMMITGLLITAAGTTGIALADSYGLFVAAMIIQSTGSAVFGPAAVAMLSESVPQNRQGTAMGIYGGFEDIGVVIGSGLGGIVWDNLGPQAAFFIIGTTTPILAAIVAFMTLKSRPAKERL